MIRLIRDHEVRRLVSFPGAVEVVAKGLTGRAGSAERSTARFGSGWLRIMSGTLPEEDVMGFKAFHLVPGAGVRYLVALYRLGDGEPLALIDGNYITVGRTSAAAAAAASRFFGVEPLIVGVIGSGRLARDGLRALAAVCRVTDVRVYSRKAENREAYAADLSLELEREVRGVDTPAAACSGADLVLCATQTGGVVALAAEDVGRARYISSVSSTLPAQRELDERVIAAAGAIVIDTADALEESGDLIAARKLGLEDERTTLLADYLSGRRSLGGAPVVYKSIGSVEQDLALATAVWRDAEQQGVGQRIEPIEAVVR